MGTIVSVDEVRHTHVPFALASFLTLEFINFLCAPVELVRGPPIKSCCISDSCRAGMILSLAARFPIISSDPDSILSLADIW